MDSSKLGERLRHIRESNKLKQREVAEAIDVNRSTYAMYEVGVRMMPLDKLIALAAFYGQTLDEILGLRSGGEPEPVDFSDKLPVSPEDSSGEKGKDVEEELRLLHEENRRLKDELLISFRRQIKLHRKIESLTSGRSSD
ncbi:helix-turn-helix transcriptional regulator [Roseivirga sp. BDSF3-8]|uniref:helix-turn-helix transcriptional regulator n=1 Tax=Roseivirga sp. BDSF3-8 TaxID=3241598 RepID=UPI003532231A